jgi:hypothetical protein
MANAEQALPSSKLHPAGKKTVAGMLAKGWIKEQMVGDQGASYVITPEGKIGIEGENPHFETLINLPIALSID